MNTFAKVAVVLDKTVADYRLARGGWNNFIYP